MDLNRIAAQLEQRWLAAYARPITVQLAAGMPEAQACDAEDGLVQCILEEVRSHGRLNGLDISTLQTDVGSAKQLRAVLVIDVRSSQSGAPVPKTKALAELAKRLRESGGMLCLRTIAGQWTRYEFVFPALPVYDQECVSAVGGETILLVEDEEFVRSIATEVLESCGYVVIPARDAAHGMEQFSRNRGSISLLLTDVVMPGGSGKTLAEKLSADDPSLKVIFMSGYTDNAVVRQQFMDPRTAYLQKPFSVDGLVRKIREVLDTPARLDSGAQIEAACQSALGLASGQMNAACGNATAD